MYKSYTSILYIYLLITFYEQTTQMYEKSVLIFNTFTVNEIYTEKNIFQTNLMKRV